MQPDAANTTPATCERNRESDDMTRRIHDAVAGRLCPALMVSTRSEPPFEWQDARRWMRRAFARTHPVAEFLSDA